MKTTEETLMLPCKLTKDEIIECSKKLVSLVNDKTMLEIEKAQESKRFKEEIDSKDDAIGHISAIISTETAERQVSCVWTYDYKEGTKTLTRKDTGEIVKTLPLTIEDRQKPLEFTIEHKKFAGQP